MYYCTYEVKNNICIDINSIRNTYMYENENSNEKKNNLTVRSPNRLRSVCNTLHVHVR